MKEPKIRFNEFKGEWKTPFIDEVFELRNGYTPSKAIDAFWKGGTIPWFRMEDIRENGGILKDAIQHVTPLGIKGNGLFEKNSIILSTTATIGVHAMLIADSLANQRFTNFSIRKSLKNSYDPMFVYYSFFGIDEWSKKNTNSGGLLSVNIPFLLKQPFFTPSLAEQHSIASFFTTLDAQISASTSRLASLKQIKAASLQAMFPQEGETVPKIRFKGFEGEWEYDEIGNICKITTGKSNTQDQVPDGQYPFFIRSEKIAKSVKYLYDTEAVITIGDGNIGKVFHYTKGKFDLHQRCYMMYEFQSIIDAKYFYYYFSTHFYDRAIKMSAKATVDSVRLDMIAKMEIKYPSFNEQRAIASYFTNLDRQITLQSQRLEKLKQIKAACLDKMFV